MIRYQQGNSYGNNFINGDEALFEDASLQRDSFGFQIRPGIQSNKNDLRTSNSGIAAQGTFFGLKSQAGQTQITDDSGNFLWNVAPITKDGATILGSPYASPSNGDVLISKSGVYAVTSAAMFIAPAGYNVNNSVNYKFYVSLICNGNTMIYTQNRGCGALDMNTVFYVGFFSQGDKLNVGFAHTDTSDLFNVSSSINLYRLS